MKLSDNTISVLKNYSTINQNLLINTGNQLKTISAQKNIVSFAPIEENFEKKIPIYDLNEFLAAMSLFDNPELDFGDDFVMMGNEGSRKSLKYNYASESVVTSVTNRISMPSEEISFFLESDKISDIIKSAAVIGVSDMVLEEGYLKVTDKKIVLGPIGPENANSYSIPVDYKTPVNVDHKFWFKVENLKLMSGNYEVTVSSKRISHFKNTNVDIEYYIALEQESYYGK